MDIYGPTEGDKQRESETKAAIGRTAGMIMAAVVYDREQPASFITPAIARKCREAALICHGVEDDVGHTSTTLSSRTRTDSSQQD
jgi:hypothetical protein